MLCADLVDVSWKDRNGRRRRSIANLEDISPSGACIQIDMPIPLKTEVAIRRARASFLGTVRYCVFREIGYFLGVEFNHGHYWSEEQFKPEHMLDPRRMIRFECADGDDDVVPAAK